MYVAVTMSQQSVYWKPSIANDNSFERDSVRPLDTSAPYLIKNRYKNLSIAQQKIQLPVYQVRKNILYAIETHQLLLLTSETGSGKSTQIPQYLYESGWCANNRCIVCTQPRRMAVISLAIRVSHEMGVELGEEVGYAIRFDEKTSKNTVIEYCTDGLLLRETLYDPVLSRYSVIMIDEAHERSLQSDILLGLLKKIMKVRKDLRVIITSATLNVSNLYNFFTNNTSISINSVDSTTKMNDVCVLNVKGKIHPVDVHYLLKPCNSYIVTSIETVLSIHRKEGLVGDILVFLPGSEDIDNAISVLKDTYDKDDLYGLPLYSSLPQVLQMRIFERTPPGMRKVIFATNIAETSLTIDNVKFVIDSCFVKLNYFNNISGVDALLTVPICQSSGKQRCGRAGRTDSGKCYRLVTEEDYLKLPLSNPCEMQRCDVTSAILQLKSLGIDDVLHFPFPSPPTAESMIYSLELLYSLNALDINCKLTAVGESMSDMPIDARLAKALLNSYDLGCTDEMLSIAAMSSIDNCFITLKHNASQESKARLLDCMQSFGSLDGDHITMLNIYNAFTDHAYSREWCDSMCLRHSILFKAKEIRVHLKRLLRKYQSHINMNNSSSSNGSSSSSSSSDTSTTATIRKCILSGYFSNVARLNTDGKYSTIRSNLSVSIHHTSIYASSRQQLPNWVVFNEIVYLTQPCIRDVSLIMPKWLLEVAPHYYDLNKKV